MLVGFGKAFERGDEDADPEEDTVVERKMSFSDREVASSTFLLNRISMMGSSSYV